VDYEPVNVRATTAALIDFARANAEANFRDLARRIGLAPEQIDKLWRGMRSLGPGIDPPA
jgi:hypothetical protein